MTVDAKHFLLDGEDKQGTVTAVSLVLLALDLGTITGWCYGTDGERYSGILHLKPGRFEGGGMRFVRFRKWLDELQASRWPIDRVVFEEVRRHLGTDAAHVYGGLMAVLTAWCEEKGIPYEGVPVGTIKKHWTGKGNASKEEMMQATYDRGIEAKDHNQSDAIALFDLKVEP